MKKVKLSYEKHNFFFWRVDVGENLSRKTFCNLLLSNVSAKGYLQKSC